MSDSLGIRDGCILDAPPSDSLGLTVGIRPEDSFGVSLGESDLPVEGTPEGIRECGTDGFSDWLGSVDPDGAQLGDPLDGDGVGIGVVDGDILGSSLAGSPSKTLGPTLGIRPCDSLGVSLGESDATIDGIPDGFCD